jgi:Transposase DDE domain
VVLADAGYWSNDHIDRLRQRGITPLVAPDADKSKGPRKTRLGGPYDFMRKVLDTARGSDLYSRRQGMVEPVFADVKQNRCAGRFKRRGRAARPLGMAPHHRHAQPSEAPPAHPGGGNGLTPGGERPCGFQVTPVSLPGVGFGSRLRDSLREEQERRIHAKAGEHGRSGGRGKLLSRASPLGCAITR